MDELRENVIGRLNEAAEYFRECRSNASLGSKAENHFWELQSAMQEAAELLKAQEQEIQQLKATHISASDNAIACGVIHGSVTINQKAKEIMNIKNVEVFNG